jgi:hypothetical protein
MAGHYTRLPSEDVELEEKPTINPTSRIGFKAIGIFFLGGAVSLAWCLIIVVVIFHQLRTHPRDQTDYTWTDCGNSSSEARSRGCLYNPFGRYWAPPECSFAATDKDYYAFRDRKWFLDKALTVDADASLLESGDLRIAWTKYWHDEHCVFVMRTLAMALARKEKMVTGMVADIDHVNHCARWVIMTAQNAYNASFLENDHRATVSELMFQTCVPMKSVYLLQNLS